MVHNFQDLLKPKPSKDNQFSQFMISLPYKYYTPYLFNKAWQQTKPQAPGHQSDICDLGDEKSRFQHTNLLQKSMGSYNFV